jgi:hypothetical protein
MHLFKLDTFLYNYGKKKWKLEEDDNMIPTYHIPKQWKLQFSSIKTEEETVENKNEVILYKYPSHYQHRKIFQYDSGFFVYFGLFGSFMLLKSLNDLIFKKAYKKSLFFGCLSAFSFLEGHIISRRVRDVNMITLKEGKTLCVKTFQDGDLEYQMDIKDTRIVSKKTEGLPDLIIFIDVNMARDKNFRFFFAEPTPATVYNPNLFYTVIYDKRYITYN